VIGYAIDETKLRKQIEKDAPGWLARARDLTSQMQAAGAYLDKADRWGEIKEIYMRLQHRKCGYCERQPVGAERREHDIDHFRPKSQVKAYANPLGFATGDGHLTGYYLLALHPLNYVVSCKTCNSDWKSTYFPIAGARVADKLHPRDYAAERPYLIYPLGPRSEDERAPEQLITFDGFLAKPTVPREQNEYWHQAGLLTIHLLGLNARDGLREERARILVQMFPLLEHLYPRPENSSGEPSAHHRSERKALARFTDASAPHASCARVFEALYQRDPERARLWFDGSRKYLKHLGRY
jgi:hypothetical protein